MDSPAVPRPISHGQIGKNVACHFERSLIVSEYVLVITFLPQTTSARLPVCDRRPLLQQLHEPAKISVIVQSLDEQVQVVRHEAVRDYREVFLRRGVQNLITEARDKVGVHEHSRSVKRAAGNKIAMQSKIGKRV